MDKKTKTLCLRASVFHRGNPRVFPGVRGGKNKSRKKTKQFSSYSIATEIRSFYSNLRAPSLMTTS